jgi:hypothetical protein
MQKLLLMVLISSLAVAVQAGEDKAGTAGEKKKDSKKGLTLEKYIANQKKSAEKKGKTFDQARVEAKFKKQDKNGDGVLDATEKTPRKKKDDKKSAEKKTESKD